MQLRLPLSSYNISHLFILTTSFRLLHLDIQPHLRPFLVEELPAS